jgi:acyl carrier protein
VTDRERIWNRLHEIFREVLDDPEIVLKPETTAADVEGWDSLTNIQILVAIEGALGISFKTGEIAGLANVGELVNRIADRMHAGPAR